MVAVLCQRSLLLLLFAVVLDEQISHAAYAENDEAEEKIDECHGCLVFLFVRLGRIYAFAFAGISEKQEAKSRDGKENDREASYCQQHIFINIEVHDASEYDTGEYEFGNIE